VDEVHRRDDHALAAAQDSSLIRLDHALAVAQFARELRNIRTKCEISDESVGDSIVRAQQYLRDRGVTETHLSIAKNWNDSTPSGFAKMSEKNCDEVLVMWMAIRARTRS